MCWLSQTVILFFQDQFGFFLSQCKVEELEGLWQYQIKVKYWPFGDSILQCVFSVQTWQVNSTTWLDICGGQQHSSRHWWSIICRVWANGSHLWIFLLIRQFSHLFTTCPSIYCVSKTGVIVPYNYSFGCPHWLHVYVYHQVANIYFVQRGHYWIRAQVLILLTQDCFPTSWAICQQPTDIF